MQKNGKFALKAYVGDSRNKFSKKVTSSGD